MRSWASLTRPLAILRSAGRAVAMPEPGVAGVVVGLPHRWTQHGAQLVFDGGDASGVGLPPSSSGRDRRLQIGQLGGGFGAPVCSLGETDGEILAALLELVPVTDEPRRDDLVRFPGGFRTIGLVGEVAALGDGGDVGSVVGEHGFEDVAGLGGVGALGYNVDPVLLAAACRADVQASAGGRRGDELDADVDGVGLVAVLGGGVAEPNVVPDVVVRERDGAVSAEVGHGERAVTAGAGDHPQVAVADRLAGGRAELSVVAAGGNEVTGVGVLAGCDGRRRAGVELADDEAEPLDGVVESVHVVVGGGRDRDRLPCSGEADPLLGDLVDVLAEPSGDDAAVVLVSVQAARVAGAEQQRGLRLPRLVEAMQAGQLVHSAGGAQLVEQTAPTDRLELARVTNQREAPLLALGEVARVGGGSGCPTARLRRR